jgi:hypothetical protein
MHRRYTPTPRRIIRCWRLHARGGTVWFEYNRRINRWVLYQASVHPVLKQLSWRLSVWFKCNRRMNRWSRRRIIWCLSAEPWPILLPNPKASDEPMLVPSVHPTVHFESNGHRTNEGVGSSDAMNLISTRPIQRLWVFCRFFCFNLASMNSMS